MAKVAIIQPIIPEYRVPLFNSLSNYHDLEVFHSGERKPKTSDRFVSKKIPRLKIGPFFFQTDQFSIKTKDIDVVIAEANLRYLFRNLSILNPLRRHPWIAWGIGVSASYSKAYDSGGWLDLLRFSIFRSADALIFYSRYPVEKYKKAGFGQQKLFVANNTVQVLDQGPEPLSKNYFLFIGSLYREKGFMYLLKQYKEASLVGSVLPLVVVGDGDELEDARAFVQSNNLFDLVEFKGRVEDPESLKKICSNALLSISPFQAGLSVLLCMGYGTPFATYRNAITGGEIFNIENGVNGVLLNVNQNLVNLLLDATENRGKYISMGINARDYYLRNASLENMVMNFCLAIDYAIGKRSSERCN